MPAQILAFPFMIAALIALYFTWEYDSSYSWYLVPNVVVMAVIYTLSPQINWWWYRRYPPKLRGKIRMLIERHLPYYQRLAEQEQERFRKRVALYMEANDFMPHAMESVPEDLKAVAACCAVQITFGQKDFLLPKFEHILFYPHPFPSPQYPEDFHSSEIYEEDKVILFSAEQLMPGFLSPFEYYNIGLHEYAKAYVRSYPGLDFPKMPDDIWEKLTQVSGFSQAAIERWINLRPIPAQPVSIAHFFTFPRQFQAMLPELYEEYVRIFNQSPVNGAAPVVGEIIQR